MRRWKATVASKASLDPLVALRICQDLDHYIRNPNPENGGEAAGKLRKQHPRKVKLYLRYVGTTRDAGSSEFTERISS